jgi:isopropylmalate/homocitrate/citramalate synthase
MATASAIAAAAAGAWPEASVNGIGERAYLKMEEYVLALELLYGVNTGIKLDKITELCSLVERITGIQNQPHKPVVGETMYVPLFEDEYLDLLKGGPYVSTAFAPEIVGQKPALVWWEGMMSAATVRAKLDQLGLPYNDNQVKKVMAAIGARLRELKAFPAWIPDAEAGEICRRALN